MVLKQSMKIALSFIFIALKHPTVIRWTYSILREVVTKPRDTQLLSHTNKGIVIIDTKGSNYQAQLIVSNSSQHTIG